LTLVKGNETAGVYQIHRFGSVLAVYCARAV